MASLQKNTDHRAELLMPAGNPERLKVAVLYGADAVYMGTPDLSLRTKSRFSLEEVREGVAFAHAHGVRVYLTLNLFSHNRDVPKIETYLETLRDIRPDGVIVADPGVFQFLKSRAEGEFDLHISTQANVCSWLTVDFWKDQGASLVVLAREVTFDELAEIRERCPDVKLEAFVHGAMCMTYSGRCLLSNFMAERGANQGNCANSCRWQYKVHLRLKDGTIQELELTEENMKLFEFVLEEGQRPGELMPIEEDARGSYILNSKDLCLMPRLDDYLRIGIDSLKVEGRTKSPFYLATVARAYRRAIDEWYADPEGWKPEPFMRELDAVGNRGYTLAFHDGRLQNYAHNYESTEQTAPFQYAGILVEITDDAFIVEIKNRLVAGDVLEFMPPDGRHSEVLIRLYDFEVVGKSDRQTVLHGGSKPRIRIPFTAFDRENIDALKAKLPVYTVLRKESLLTEENLVRMRLDRLSRQIETGAVSDTHYAETVEKLRETIGAEAMERRSRTSRQGIEGCCGRGCNGCLIFWNDPSYARARELLAHKKQGELLDRNMREIPVAEAGE